MDFEAGVGNGLPVWVANEIRISCNLGDRPLSGQRLNLFTKLNKQLPKIKNAMPFDKSFLST